MRGDLGGDRNPLAASPLHEFDGSGGGGVADVNAGAGVTREQCVAGHDRFFGCSRPPGQAETRGRGALVGDRTDGQTRLFRVLSDQDAQ